MKLAAKTERQWAAFVRDGAMSLSGIPGVLRRDIAPLAAPFAGIPSKPGRFLGVDIDAIHRKRLIRKE